MISVVPDSLWFLQVSGYFFCFATGFHNDYFLVKVTLRAFFQISTYTAGRRVVIWKQKRTEWRVVLLQRRNSVMPRVMCLIFYLSLFCHVPAALSAESWIYAEGEPGTAGVILCHGKGGDPESFVVEPLRLELNEQLAFHTLSLQMPGGIQALAEYEKDFPKAYVEIKRAVRFLQAKGIETIYLMAHSLGSRMATAYLADMAHPAIKGFVGVGMLNNNGVPFSCLLNLEKTSLPVLDIWGEAGRAGDSDYAMERRILLSPRYTQIAIPAADHALSEHEDELVEAVIAWLRQQEQNGQDNMTLVTKEMEE